MLKTKLYCRHWIEWTQNSVAIKQSKQHGIVSQQDGYFVHSCCIILIVSDAMTQNLQSHSPCIFLLSCGENSPQIKTLSRTNESKKELVISWPLELVIVPTIDVWH
jgi:hypothetical protein